MSRLHMTPDIARKRDESSHPVCRRPVLAVLGFALLGTLVGAFTIIVGIGPKTMLDLALHAALLLGLIGTLVATWRLRRR